MIILLAAAEKLAHRLGLGGDSACRSLLHQYVAVAPILESEDYKIHSLVETHYEPCHRRLSYGNRISGAHLFDPQRNHRPARAHHVSISCAANLCLAGETALRHSHLLLDSLCYTHCVYGVGGLVGGQTDNSLHSGLDGRGEHIVGAYHIRFHGLHREELAGRHLFESRCMENVVHTRHSRTAALERAHIADEELNLVCHLRETHLIFVAHIVLLLLVA